ncbi:MAG: hypothetical protein LPK45_05505, partial [Bacteroidota bacterium]|nr:hypothetical protein [Bacteroidota bacterium]MDX5430523.1 hypothetical protein [Bacteroidota bacterium]MDX5469276.1 hypothetical protein [Bacteroidota bacterium]
QEVEEEQPTTNYPLPPDSHRDSEEEVPNDLASKFSNTPISDLKQAISIAKKFELINTLFSGDVQKYAVTIHQINNFRTGDEAFGLLHQLKDEFAWDEEDKNFVELANLVRRRFLG